MQAWRALARRVAGDGLLLALLVALPPLLWLVPRPPAALAGLVDWKTVAALAGLMVLSRGLDQSGALDRAGRALARRVRSERGLALALTGFAAALSAVVTNDVALFITVPLTLTLARRAGVGQGAGLPVGRLVIFQALAVNAGSAISPVGNPQNLFLWQHAGVGPWVFLLAMAPLVIGLLAGLALLTWWGFSTRPLDRTVTPPPACPLDPALAGLCLLAYPAFLMAVNSGWAVAAALVVTGVLALWHRRVLAGVDWALLPVFVLMFVNLGLLAQWPAVAALVPQAAALPGGMMTLAALVSQGMSNVPAAIFLAPFAPDWVSLAWGVSIGGYGLALGSLANLIALRLARVPGLWREFHLWSLAMFGLALALGLALQP